MSNLAAKLCLLAVAGVALAACTTGRQHLSDDFGRSLREDLVAQIADPDARYTGDPAPASSGKRSAIAQSRYERNAVIPPIASSVSGAMSSQGAGASPGAAQ